MSWYLCLLSNELSALILCNAISWNVGILESMRRFKDCWVAILDDDDEWRENHIEKCLEAAAKDKDCQWVASGIIRESRNSSTHEPLMLNQPVASDFFSTNPGIQGSNMFVRGEL